jgi:hypothetical protein
MEFTSVKQRVWFRLRNGLERQAALEELAALLLLEKPEEIGIHHVGLYPPGEGANAEDSLVETFVWRVLVPEGVDGHRVNEQLADKARKRLAQPT